MSRKHISFYFLSFLAILVLLFSFHDKMRFTYEAKDNFVIFKEISSKFQKNLAINYDDLKGKKNITVYYSKNQIKFAVDNISPSSCLRYGVDYIDSNFTSITVNSVYYSRKDAIRRDSILANCSKKFNNIIISQIMEKK